MESHPGGTELEKWFKSLNVYQSISSTRSWPRLFFTEVLHLLGLLSPTSGNVLSDLNILTPRAKSVFNKLRCLHEDWTTLLEELCYQHCSSNYVVNLKSKLMTCTRPSMTWHHILRESLILHLLFQPQNEKDKDRPHNSSPNPNTD